MRSLWMAYLLKTLTACFAGVVAALTAQAAVTVAQYRPHDFAFSATVSGNPFAVEFAGEFAGPDGARLRVPGFHDGDGVWKIRFMAPRAGKWRLRTVSSVPALNGREEEITALANANPHAHGLPRVDPDHPHHFKFDDGTRFFLLGYEADWLAMVGMRDPERRAMRRLVEQISGRGFNYVLVNVYAHDTRWAPGRSCEWDFGPPELFVFGGTNEQPDHTRLNPAFFRAFDQMMEALWERGVVAHVMVKVYNNTAWDVVKADPEPPGMARWQALRRVLSELPYWRLSPCNELAVGGPALCDRARHYAFYVPGKKVTINLRGMEGAAAARWVNTWTDEQVDAGSLKPAVVTLSKPAAFGDAPAVLVVRVREEAQRK